MINKYISLDYKFPKSVMGKLLHVYAIKIDEYAIRICYTFTPPIPEIVSGSMHPLFVRWNYHATDDEGNNYIEAGGACGLSKDGQFTDGVLSLIPLPSKNASFLSFFLNPYLKDGDSFEYKFQVNLNNKISN